jgi:hypothetical protein
MRHILLVPILLALVGSAAASDCAVRASYGNLPTDSTTTYDISGGGQAQSYDWSTSGSASRMALGVNALWSGMNPTGGWADSAVVTTLGVEQIAKKADAGAMTSASETKLRGLYLEPGIILGIYGHLGLELCGRFAIGRGTYTEDELGDASASYRTYGALIRPVYRLGRFEVFGEAAWTSMTITADGISPAGSPDTSIAVSQVSKGLSYGAGIGYRF